MYLLFLDESGTPPRPEKARGRYMVLGGVIIPEGAWVAVKNELSRIKKKYKVTGEVKWKFFGTGSKREDNNLSHLSNPEKDLFRADVFDIMTSRKSIKLLCCVTSIEAAYRMETVKNQDDIYSLTYKGISERFQYFLQDASRVIGQSQYGMIISDHRMQQDDDKLRARHHDMIDNNTKYTSDYKNIIETVLFSPSHVSPGLQLADMVAGAVHRAYQYGEVRFAAAIRSAFRQSPNGEISGYGIIKMPKFGFIEPEKREPSGGDMQSISPTR